MTNRHWLLAFGVGLVVLPVVLYALHFLIYRDLHHIGIYTLGDIAFLPLEGPPGDARHPPGAWSPTTGARGSRN